MPLILIAAAAGEKQVIGKDGDLPWHFSADLRYFKEKTLGHPVLMGRKTYDSILARLGKPLPGRKNLVLTRNPDFKDDRATILRDLSEIPTNETLFVIGGASLYAATLPLAQTIYLTHIEKDFAGDAYFPRLDPAVWHLADETRMEENGTALRFCRYERN
jgi:dihydrofolate reductase